jgi:hypothetical protein
VDGAEFETWVQWGPLPIYTWMGTEGSHCPPAEFPEERECRRSAVLRRLRRVAGGEKEESGPGRSEVRRVVEVRKQVGKVGGVRMRQGGLMTMITMTMMMRKRGRRERRRIHIRPGRRKMILLGGGGKGMRLGEGKEEVQA